MLLYAIINHGVIHPFDTLGFYYILLVIALGSGSALVSSSLTCSHSKLFLDRGTLFMQLSSTVNMQSIIPLGVWGHASTGKF